MGPRNITLTEAAETLSEALNKPVVYRQKSMSDAERELTDFGLPETVRRELIDLFKALGDPGGVYATARTFEALTPTTFEEFVENKLIAILNP